MEAMAIKIIKQKASNPTPEYDLNNEKDWLNKNGAKAEAKTISDIAFPEIVPINFLPYKRGHAIAFNTANNPPVMPAPAITK